MRTDEGIFRLSNIRLPRQCLEITLLGDIQYRYYLQALQAFHQFYSTLFEKKLY